VVTLHIIFTQEHLRQLDYYIYRLQTGSPSERVLACAHLGSLGGPRAIAALSHAAIYDPWARAREAALEALGTIGSPTGLTAAIQALQQDVDHDVREQAAQTLGIIGDVQANAALTVASRFDPDTDVRWAAQVALQRIAARAYELSHPIYGYGW